MAEYAGLHILKAPYHIDNGFDYLFRLISETTSTSETSSPFPLEILIKGRLLW